MRHIRNMWLAAVVIAVATPMSGVLATDKMSKTTDPSFTPGSGQINPGFDRKLPSDSASGKIPTHAEAVAAAMTPVSTQPSTGTSDNQPSTNLQTNGLAPATSAAPAGPIGAIGVTVPAKFSQRNDTLDRVPVMALPLPLSEQQRKTIYQAVMADKVPAATDADHLAPAGVLSSGQYFNDLHPLPETLRSIGAVKSLAYVKTKNKVLLIEPSTRIVFDEIDS